MELFDVKIVRFNEHTKEPPRQALKRVFGMDDARAERVLMQMPCVVKRGVPLETALKFVHALALIGAEVSLGAHTTISIPPPTRGERYSVSLPPPSGGGREIEADSYSSAQGALELDLRGGTGRKSSGFPASKAHSSSPPANGVAMASYIPPAPTLSTHPSMTRSGHPYASRRPPPQEEPKPEKANVILWLTVLAVVVVLGVALRALRGGG